jgi:hypothetical protein
LVDGDAHYLYINCEQSASSFPIMVRLTPEEYAEYHALGWTFFQYMAEKIKHWASTYSARRVKQRASDGGRSRHRGRHGTAI